MATSIYDTVLFLCICMYSSWTHSSYSSNLSCAFTGYHGGENSAVAKGKGWKFTKRGSAYSNYSEHLCL